MALTVAATIVLLTAMTPVTSLTVPSTVDATVKNAAVVTGKTNATTLVSGQPTRLTASGTVQATENVLVAPFRVTLP